MSERLHALSNQTLLFDADDTLWENNIYFERAIASFITFLDHHIHTAAEVREHLDRIEHETIAAHGYGTGSFRRSLIRCFEELSRRAASAAEQQRLTTFANAIASHAMELLPGVAATVRTLHGQHRLILMTKGDALEQRDKLERSGLAPYFSAVEVPREKDAEAYRDVLARHALDPATTWMIGNSPRSDINPALAAGLNAIFIAHDFTWVLEHASLDAPTASRQLIELATFPALLELFAPAQVQAPSALY